MFFADSLTPLKKFPPPTTIPIWTPVSLAFEISSAILVSVLDSIPKLVS